MSGEIRRTRTPPTLTTVGKRQVISSGRWNDLVMADYIAIHGETRSIEISELAKIAYGHNNLDTKAKVRRYLHKIFAILIDRGKFMISEIETGRSRKAIAVRLHRHDGSEADQQSIEMKLNGMLRRRELSIERYDRAMAALCLGKKKAEEDGA